MFNSALEFDEAEVDTMGKWFETGEMRTVSIAVMGKNYNASFPRNFSLEMHR